MLILLIIKKVTCKLQDGRTLFSDVSISLLSKTVVGVVGPNGAGKSTFLKLLAGRESNYQGRISVREGARVTYLAQEPELDENLDVRSNVALGGGEAATLLKRFNEVNDAMGVSEGNELDELLAEQSDLLVKLDECDAWDLDNRVDKAMAALSLPPPHASIGSLSGGEKRRVALCRALMEVCLFVIEHAPIRGLCKVLSVCCLLFPIQLPSYECLKCSILIPFFFFF